MEGEANLLIIAGHRDRGEQWLRRAYQLRRYIEVSRRLFDESQRPTKKDMS